ncbi:MAG: mycothiol synthase, partial [Chloroflexota bacterium]
AYDAEHLVGYANVQRFPSNDGGRLSAEMVVHPEARRQGVASLMLEAAINMARNQHLSRVDIWAYRQMSGTRELARTFGFHLSRTLLELRMTIPARMPEAPRPDGVELRSFLPGKDDAEWLELNNHVFSGHPEQGNWDPGDLAARLKQTWFDPADFIVGTRGGRLVAYNWLKLDHQSFSGEIYVIGIHPDLRHAHFGHSLTIIGLEHMQRRGMRDASAYVDALNSRALSLYYDLGFTVDHADVCYSKPLEEEPAG